MIDAITEGASTSEASSGTTEIRNKIVEFVKKQVGKPYIWGSEGPEDWDGDGETSEGYDCSGLVSAACHYAGLKLGRQTAATFYTKCTVITKDKLKAGDLGFKIDKEDIPHIGVYVGEDKWVEAMDSDHGIVESNGSSFNGFGVLKGVDDGVNIPIPSGSVTVEPIYPDLTTPPGSQPKEYDQDKDNDVPDPKTPKKKDEFPADLKNEVDKGTKTPMDAYSKRQQIFNPKDHKKAIKEVKGKPANYSDPYPVDLKIVEMEAHLPRVKDQSDISKLAIAAEKRIVQLENVVSVLARNLFRMSSRVQINCVYYGGQNSFGKYDCIRCLNSDMINDGAIVTLDQCLNCTRYEPIAGQVYDILEEDNQNLALVLDTAQSSYMSMEEIINLNRIEEMHNETSHADLHVNAKKPPKPLSDGWKEGFKMDWQETPVESQVPKINSYQYGDGPLYNADEIFQAGMRNAQASAAGLEGGGGSSGELMFDSGNSLDPEYHGAVKSSDPWLQQVIDRAVGYASGASKKAVDNMVANGYKDHVVKYSLDAGVDPYLMLALITTESTGNPKSENAYYGGLMQISKSSYSDWANVEMNIKHGIDHYLGKCKAVKTEYPLFSMIAYNAGEGVVLGADGFGAPALSGWPGIRNGEAKWCDVAPALKKQVQTYFAPHGWDTFEKVEYFLKIMYCYHNLKKVIKEKGIKFYDPPVPAGVTPFDNKYRLPVEAAELKNIYFTSDYGYRNIGDGQEYHNGIDLAPSFARLAKGDVYAVAAESGVVVEASKDSGRGNYAIIQHSDGYSTVYYHMQDNKVKVKSGDKVTRGQKIGAMGTTGRSTGVHLHFGVKTVKGGTYIDPKTMFKNLNTRVNKSLG